MGSVFGSLVRQFSTQNIQEGVNESSRQLSALVKNTPSLAFEQSDDNDNQLSQLQQNISQPNLVSNLGQINVGQPQSNLAASSAIIPNPKTRELVDALKAKR